MSSLEKDSATSSLALLARAIRTSSVAASSTEKVVSTEKGSFLVPLIFRRAASFTFTIWWYRRWFGAVSHLHLASLCIVLVLHRVAGGPAAAAAHVRGVIVDLAMPFAVSWRAPRFSPREQGMRLALSLCTATSYVYAYGPLCTITNTALVRPATTLWSFANMVRGGRLGPYYLGVLVAGTLAFHFGYQLIISTLLHRYFSHRAFAASRPLNALLALVAVAANQRGPLWWASTHRRHHRFCDRDGDPHSPVAVPPEHAALPWFHSHLLWLTRRENFAIQADNVGDWLQQTPELLALELFSFEASLYLEAVWQLAFKRLGRLSWRWASIALTLRAARVLGYSLSLHVTMGLNSLCHDAKEEDKGLPVGRSRNLAWLGIFSCGEAYHANHHAAARDARHAPPGRTDLAHAVMRGAARLGLIALPHAKGE